MTYTVEDAIELHKTITASLASRGADDTYTWLTNEDPELLALALTLHMLQKVPRTTVQ